MVPTRGIIPAAPSFAGVRVDAPVPPVPPVLVRPDDTTVGHRPAGSFSTEPHHG
ncbi:hypothetical protein [Streptomyces sp. H27-D2]|uniref:hypothetical protein n=1 Tax=Streptomyces sp. H27-D2 TaxID=3046304 RepID=UPI002DB5A6EF|nr:hypothetical protein [Streptomyces sp. H27-D2]MEC4019945.1 hypothetical protein [Streptomyces sp. H27-D2]